MAIAGGGVGGLATAFYMLKSGFDVTVFEKTSAFARFGGPIQFASNALSVIKVPNLLYFVLLPLTCLILKHIRTSDCSGTY